jgi:VCBS repeat-containing protein
LIQWTPSAGGLYDIAVQATNANGTDTLSFQIDVNSPPGATADQYGPVDQGALLTVNAANGVLANDTDVDGDGITAVLVQSVSHGTLTLNSDGSFEYQNDGSENSTDSFTYQASDGTGQSAVTTVSLTINVPGGGGGGGDTPAGGGGGGGGCFISTMDR